MNPIIPIAGGLATLGGLAYFLGVTPSRRWLPQSPTAASKAALAVVPANVAGVAMVKAANGSPLDTLRDHRRALVQAYGADADAVHVVPYPARMTVGQLRAEVDAWTAALEAGRDVDDDTTIDFALSRRTAGMVSDVIDRALWTEVKAGGDPFGRLGLTPTDLGRYAVTLYTWRRVNLDPLSAGADLDWSGVSDAWPATQATIRGTFDRLTDFVGGIEGVSFTVPGGRPSDQSPGKHVAGAVGAAADASVDAAKHGLSYAANLAIDIITDIVTNPVVLVGAAVVGTGIYLTVRRG